MFDWQTYQIRLTSRQLRLRRTGVVFCDDLFALRESTDRTGKIDTQTAVGSSSIGIEISHFWHVIEESFKSCTKASVQSQFAKSPPFRKARMHNGGVNKSGCKYTNHVGFVTWMNYFVLHFFYVVEVGLGLERIRSWIVD